MENRFEEFEKMRPYNDSEVNQAINRILEHKEIHAVIKYLFPEKDIEQYLAELSNITSVDDFQSVFSFHAVDSLIKKTCDSFTVKNIENLPKDKPCLFIANHRDIVLDSALLQYVLFLHQCPTTQITFGSNLMSSQFVIDLGKLNKMFTFYRDKSKLALVKNAYLHADYIKHVIVNQKESIWIAQRDGRTKDGFDITQQSVLKMLFGLKNFSVESIRELNIVPVSISYEFEPCLKEKIVEKLVSQEGKYVKDCNEDFNSILTGLVSHKGNVCLGIGKPLNSVIDSFSDCNSSELLARIASFIDREIYENFEVWPLNYLAYDRLHNCNDHKDKYTSNDGMVFEEYQSFVLDQIDMSYSRKNEMFLSNLAEIVRIIKS